MDFPRVDEVEDLEHDECVEDEGEVPRVVLGLVKGCDVIGSSRNSVKPSAADGPCPLVEAVECPFVLLLISCVCSRVQRVFVFGDVTVAEENEGDHHQHLVDRMPNDVLFHQLRDDAIVTGVGFSEEQLFVGVFGRERKGSEGVHNQVDPQHLNGFQDFLLQKGRAHKGTEHSNDVDCQLELKELSD